MARVVNMRLQVRGDNDYVIEDFEIVSYTFDRDIKQYTSPYDPSEGAVVNRGDYLTVFVPDGHRLPAGLLYDEEGDLRGPVQLSLIIDEVDTVIEFEKAWPIAYDNIEAEFAVDGISKRSKNS